MKKISSLRIVQLIILSNFLIFTHGYASTNTDTIYLDFNDLIGANGTATFFITSGNLQAPNQPGLPEFYMNEISVNANEMLSPISSASGDWSCYTTASVTTGSCILSSTTLPINSSAITDGDIETGMVLLGGGATNKNGIEVEYPAFAKFDFNLDRSLGSIALNVAASSNVRNSFGGNTWFGFLNQNTDEFNEFYNSFDADIADGIDTFSVTIINTSMVPEPETYGMFLAGLGLIGLASIKQHKLN